MRLFKQMAKEYPKEKIVYIFLGIDLQGAQLYPEAITEFNKALELDTKFGWAYEQLAATCIDMGGTQKVIHFMSQL